MNSWRKCKIGDVLEIVKKEKVESPQNYYALTVQLHGKGIKNSGKRPVPTERGRPYYIRNEGEILIGRQNFHNGGIGIVPKSLDGLIASNAISSFKCKENENDKFIELLFQWYGFYKKVDNLIGGTGQKEISEPEILKIPIAIPSNKEQARIVEILDSIESTLKAFKKRIIKTQALKKGVMNDLYQLCLEEGKVLKDSSTFDVVKMGDIFKDSKLKGVDGIPLASVTKGRGIVPRSEEEKKVETNLKAEDHLWVKKGWIAYNMMRMWQGVQGIANQDFLVSPAYVVLEPKNKNINTQFYNYLFQTEKFIRLFHQYSYGLTNDRLRLYYADFSKIPVPLPSLKQQDEVVKVIREIDSLISTLNKKIERLEYIKKGLKKDFFTGDKKVI
ncbi:restriction endonuclease subunit S [Halobacteriovorax sp.]|uniref:restriction endonuclease subunit S n=1 Tax=Halobacteriovorax sp. TaxID=2020862 RepID=UPI003AF2E74D